MNIFQKVIINADDFGLSLGICKAIDELMKLGAISDTTVMMLTPDVAECAKHYPYVFLNNKAGVHLQLPGKIALTQFEKKVSKHIINEENIKKEDVLKLDKQRVFDEWDSQIACFIRMFKQRPTHLDSHMGYHRTVEFREVYLALAQKYKIPVRGGEAPFPSIMRAYNVNGTTRFVRGWSGKELPYGTLKNKLLELKKSSDPLKDVIEITCHPGYVDDVLCARSHLTVGRKHDYNEVLDIYKTNWLKKNGFELVSFNNL